MKASLADRLFFEAKNRHCVLCGCSAVAILAEQLRFSWGNSKKTHFRKKVITAAHSTAKIAFTGRVLSVTARKRCSLCFLASGLSFIVNAALCAVFAGYSTARLMRGN